MLARDRVVLLLDQLVGHGARILLGDVIEAGVRRRNELDLDGDRFGHVQNLKLMDIRSRPNRPAFAAQPSLDPPKVKVLRANTVPSRGTRPALAASTPATASPPSGVLSDYHITPPSV